MAQQREQKPQPATARYAEPAPPATLPAAQGREQAIRDDFEQLKQKEEGFAAARREIEKREIVSTTREQAQANLEQSVQESGE